MKERVSAMLTQIDNSDRPMVVQIVAVGRAGLPTGIGS